ncbi:MAG TPA: DUF3000 family protein [Streptosporangiaceae bacterium]|nr:DUF3000 family protein [Streptosporangiaceae bacterium]
MPQDRHTASNSAFQAAVAQIEIGVAEQRQVRPEVIFEGEPPPRRLAPQAAAIAATVEVDRNEIGWGRFVLLYDPAGQDGWAGPFRVIGYVRAELEPEIAADQLIREVGWSWLTEALDARSTGYAAPSGTVTTVQTEGFGTKQDEAVVTEFEMRASWSPVSDGRDDFRIDRHVGAWVDAMCVACGRPPAPPGVAQLRPPAPLRRAERAAQIRPVQPGPERPGRRP